MGKMKYVLSLFVVLMIASLLLASAMFTTGRAEAAGTNLVGPGTGCYYGASSETPGYEASHAFDGDIYWPWVGNDVTPYNQQWLAALFPQTSVTFNTVKIAEYYDDVTGYGKIARTGRYRIAYTTDQGYNWTTVYTGYIFAFTPNKTTITFPTVTLSVSNPFDAGIIIFFDDVNSSNPYASAPLIYEFEVYNNTEQPRDLDTGYLLDANLYCGCAYRYNPHGWLKEETEGCTVTNSFHYDQLDDTSSSTGVKLYHNFLPQSASTVACEFRFNFPTSVFDAATFKLRDGSTDAVVFYTSGGHLYYGALDLGAPTTNVWHGVKLTANVSTKQVTAIYYDGTKKTTSALNFTNTGVTDLDNFSAETGAPTGTLQIGKTSIYKGYHINETLATAAVVSNMSTAVNGWTKAGTGGTVGVQERPLSGGDGYWPVEIKSFKINDTSTSANVYITNTIASQTGNLVFEYNFMLPIKKNGVYADLLSSASSSNIAVRIITAGTSDAAGNLCYVNSSGQNVALVTNYKANVWYRVKAALTINASAADTVSYYVNDVLKTPSPVATRYDVTNLNRARFSTTNAMKLDPALGEAWWVDDAQLYVTTAYDASPTSPVPTPVPAATGNYYMMAQRWDLWKEGMHASWDILNLTGLPYYPGFHDRKPVLGWYDEGDPEVTDWEIKYAVEHGINAFLFSWSNSLGGPPKDNDNWTGHAVIGLLKSKYKDYMKFAVVFPVTNTNDMQNNLLPFFIEHYFKHPNYLKTSDNKPIIAMHNLPSLIGELGSEAAVANFLNQLRSAVDAEPGLDGLLILSEYMGTDYAGIQQRLNCGADYIYCYTWIPPQHNTDDATMITNMKNNLLAQRDNSGGRAVPTISMGWDHEPYVYESYGTNVSYRFHPASFQNVSYWVKNTFGPPVIDPAGHMLISLDNWNEYGEGHFLAPTDPGENYIVSENAKRHYNFGYLDAVRRVFKDPPDSDGGHEDWIPYDINLGPYDILYPNGW